LLGWRYMVSLTLKPALGGIAEPTDTNLQIDDLILWVTFGIIVGGRLGSAIFYDANRMVSDPLEVFKIWQGGMSFHGGFIGVCVACALFARSSKIDLLRLGDIVAASTPFGLLFGRIANFINGELWGRPTDVPWAMIFPAAGPEPRHPSQLYQAALEGILLFLILRFATHRLGWLQRQGGVAGLFMVGYGLIRVFLENFRQPDVGMPDYPFGLTMGMILSIPMILIGAWLVWRAHKTSAAQ
jgi:phosphatidylglycerol:prolipoprotein diacylglycerol transferase